MKWKQINVSVSDSDYERLSAFTLSEKQRTGYELRMTDVMRRALKELLEREDRADIHSER